MSSLSRSFPSLSRRRSDWNLQRTWQATHTSTTVRKDRYPSQYLITTT
ncbi:unnamed protein product [Timema podura]|uniref:Uncharacterized protein n=1 Tax=Timema podura TaxID=61482 RepID=A0ABN7NRX0_TIMPD|nr:unnamed protein product [Timema podura]